MAVFRYEAYRMDGKKDYGVLTAENRRDAEAKLRIKNITVTKLTPVESTAAEHGWASLRERSEREHLVARIMVSLSEKERICDYLGIMIDGGVPIVTALRTTASLMPMLSSRALFCAANRLESGSTFVLAMESELDFLGSVFLGMFRAGEANGGLEDMCAYARDMIARRRKIRAQVIQALSYPVFVLFLMIGVVAFMMTQVIPKLMKFLDGRGAELPQITQLLVDVVHVLQNHTLSIIGLPVILAVGIFILHHNRNWAKKIDFLLLKIPLFGKVFSHSSNTLWTRTLGILLRSGIHILPALDYTKKTLANHFYQNEIEHIENIVMQGHPLSTAFRVSSLRSFCPMADAMLIIGENTGRVDTGLLKVADFSEAEMERRLGLLTKLLEPTLFLLIGGIIGFVYIAFILGMISVSSGQNM